MNTPRILFAAACFAAFAAQAQTSPASDTDHAAHHASDAASLQSAGEVRKIDKEQGKITLRHGPIDNLGMPPMTMVFKAADPKVLEGLKEGDKVKFTAERLNGAIAVTAIQVVQ